MISLPASGRYFCDFQHNPNLHWHRQVRWLALYPAKVWSCCYATTGQGENFCLTLEWCSSSIPKESTQRWAHQRSLRLLWVAQRMRLGYPLHSPPAPGMPTSHPPPSWNACIWNLYITCGLALVYPLLDDFFFVNCYTQLHHQHGFPTSRCSHAFSWIYVTWVLSPAWRWLMSNICHLPLTLSHILILITHAVSTGKGLSYVEIACVLYAWRSKFSSWYFFR